MIKMKFQLKVPKKTDYPNSLKILNHSNKLAEYHQVIEASASAYFETKGPTKWLFRKRFETVLAYISKIGKVDKLLDAGTGIGFFLPSLSKAANQVVAIDNTNFSLNYAKFMVKKRKITNVRFKKTKLENLDLKDGQFEVIVCLSVLEHIPPEKLNQVAYQFKRVLKPSGSIIVGYPNEGSLLFKLLQQLERRLFRGHIAKALKNKNRIKFQTLGHVATAEQISQMLDKHFTVKKEKTLPFGGINLYKIQWRSQ